MKCLVIRFSSLGDIVLTTPVVQSLAAAFPDAEIHYASSARYATVLDHFPQKVITHLFDGRRKSEFSAYAADLAGKQYDLVLDLHGNWRSRMLVHQVRAKRVFIYPADFWRRWQMVYLKRGLDRSRPVVMRYLETIKATGVPVATDVPRLHVDPVNRKAAAAELFRFGWPVGRATVGIGWGARWPAKKVTVQLWDELISGLNRRDKPAYIIFSEAEDKTEIAEFIARYELADMFVFCGKPLDLVLGAVSVCSAFVSSDSGLMHAAAAMGVPTLGIFGPTHPALGFAPRGVGTKAVHSGIFCSPCSRHGKAACYRGQRYCFEQIDTAALIQDISTVLKKADRE